MRLRDLLYDFARLLSLACLGLCLFGLVVVLALASRGLPVPWGDFGYGCMLAVLALSLGMVWELRARRPLARDLAARRQVLAGGGGALAAMRLAGTREQRAWAALVNAEHARGLREVQERERQKQFYEAFLTRFAHQMKTPLSVISLLLVELREAAHKGDAGTVLALLDSLTEEKERLYESIDLILQTARVASFRFDARVERVDVVSVVREVVNEHKSAWIRRRLYPRIDAGEAAVYAHTDRKWLRFICEQLVRNALQYGVAPGADEGAPFVIRVRRRDDDVLIEFRDEGIGIPEADLPRIFQPFFTGANGRVHSRATGMGLYLVKEVCAHLGHDISVASSPGHGTTFTLTLHASRHLAPAVSTDNLTSL
ncbi:MAG: sensor histidine kinase [Alicyclobacillaceae bacterium]|nr:sensor histidine kinase [Alicyclobacillaceae bacterium]